MATKDGGGTNAIANAGSSWNGPLSSSQLDPKSEFAIFWLVDVTFLTKQGDRINFCDYLKDILACAEHRVLDGTPTHILSWYSPESDIPSMAQRITRHLSETVWNDPDAYTYQVIGASQ